MVWRGGEQALKNLGLNSRVPVANSIVLVVHKGLHSMATEGRDTKRPSIFKDPPNSVKTLRRAYKDKTTRPNTEKLLAELKGESDRAAIIHISALLDDALSITIAKKFCFEPIGGEFDRCFRFDGPLGSFSSKIEIACLFGVIDDRLAQQWTLIREMRNACAHSKHALTFSDDELANVAVRLGKPLGEFDFDNSNQQTRKYSFIIKAMFTFTILNRGSREQAWDLMAEMLKKHSAPSSSPDKSP